MISHQKVLLVSLSNILKRLFIGFDSKIGGYELDLPQFSKVMRQFGGLQKVTLQSSFL